MARTPLEKLHEKPRTRAKQKRASRPRKKLRKPLLRSRKHEPRKCVLVPSPARKFWNVAADLVEIASSPLARVVRRRIGVEERAIPVEGLAPEFEGYRIAFLTDFHTSPIVSKAWLTESVAIANGLGPDLIALGGDFVSSHARHLPAFVRAASKLRAPDGVVGVLGNHDHNVGADLVRRALDEAGVTLLRNRARILERGAARLAVGGVADLISDVIDIGALLSGIPPGMPRIILSHNPDVFALWPAGTRLDLMLSGHTHGGQVRLPILGAPYVPSSHGERFAEGLVEEDGRRLYVSRGVGVLLVPIRWGCPAEVTAITLERAR